MPQTGSQNDLRDMALCSVSLSVIMLGECMAEDGNAVLVSVCLGDIDGKGTFSTFLSG